MERRDELADFSESLLNSSQREVLAEWKEKNMNVCMALSMGFGKTLLSITAALSVSYNGIIGRRHGPILVIISKALLAGWISEIEKWFGAAPECKLGYEVLHAGSVGLRDLSTWEPNPNTRLIIVTGTRLARAYKENNLHREFVKQQLINPMTFENLYINPTTPATNVTMGIQSIFSRVWDIVIIDEVQDCVNILADNCRAISTICAKRRLALSGTPIKNPKIESLMGYYCVIDDKTVPRTLESLKQHISSPEFPGIGRSMILRKTNESAKSITIVQQIVSHGMCHEEEQIYRMFKRVVKAINQEIRTLRRTGADTRTLASRLMATLTYLRQSLVVPVLPITTIAISMADYTQKNELSAIIHREIQDLGLSEWLNDINCIKSSRIKAILKTLSLHNKERIVCFACHRTSIDVIKYFIKDREVFTLTSKMDIPQRSLLIESFTNSRNGILMLTNKIGGVGLNLQMARVCLVVDFDWTEDTTKQSITRLARMGQPSDNVMVYFFACGAGIEKAVLTKQLDKKIVIDQLMTGRAEKLVGRISFEQFVADIIDTEDNIELIDRIYITKV